MPYFRKLATVVAGAAIAIGCGSAAAFAASDSLEKPSDHGNTVERPDGTDHKPGKPVEGGNADTVQRPDGTDHKPGKPVEKPGKGEKPAEGESVHIIKDEDGGIRIIKGDVPDDAKPVKPAEPAK